MQPVPKVEELSSNELSLRFPFFGDLLFGFSLFALDCSNIF